MIFTELTVKDLPDWLEMALALWQDEEPAILTDHFHEILASPRWRTILCRDADGNAIAFINLSIRYEYVEGSDSSPVGYIEGIYVKPEHRKKGIASALIERGEDWSYTNGCKEFASDTEIENTESQAFHRRAGFAREQTIVHFIKTIDR